MKTGWPQNGWQPRCWKKAFLKWIPCPEPRRRSPAPGTFAYSLIIMDPAMERADGWELFRTLRALLPQAPVLIVSARCSVKRRVQGLELGAHDYLCKPCDWAEFLARLRAIVRRHRLTNPVRETGSVLRVADLIINVHSHRVERGGTPLALTAREYRLLVTLASAGGGVVSHDTLRRDVWGLPDDSLSNAVAMAISRLRRKVDAAPWPALIHKVHGYGYRLTDPSAVEVPA